MEQQPTGQDRPSEAELRAMVAEMREAPVEETLVGVTEALLQAAQIKVGRPDARLLIDVVAAMAGAIGARARGDLAAQMGQAVAQLQLAQVDAERELGTAPDAASGTAAPAPTAAPGAGPAPAPAPAAAPPGPSAASRLWVPGR